MPASAYWVGDGNTLTEAHSKATTRLTSPGAIGFCLHGLVGMMLIPLLALVLLIISFFAKIPGGVKWAAIVVGLVVLQIALRPSSATRLRYVGLLHGLNALILFTVALHGRSHGRGAVGGRRADPD